MVNEHSHSKPVTFLLLASVPAHLGFVVLTSVLELTQSQYVLGLKRDFVCNVLAETFLCNCLAEVILELRNALVSTLVTVTQFLGLCFVWGSVLKKLKVDPSWLGHSVSMSLKAHHDCHSCS